MDDPRHDQRILPGTDYADMSTVSRKTWLVHHLLAVGELSAFYGEPGSGKSVLAQDIGLHLAAGLPWFGRQVRPSAVLYIALERAAVVARRALAFGIEHNLVAERLPFRMVRGPLDFRDFKVAADIVGTVADLADRYQCEAGLVIVDTVSRALCGGDENSPKDMGGLIANLGRIQGAIDIHLALTHHQPAEKERMRGHGALLGAVDTTVHVTKSATARSAEVVKSSDHEEGQRVAFSLKSVTIGQDEQGAPITAPVVVEETSPGVRQKAGKRAKPIPKNEQLALNALCDALVDHGELVVNPHIPIGRKVVKLEKWRDYAWQRGLGGEEVESRQKAFKRAKENLAGGGHVGIWEPYAWPV